MAGLIQFKSVKTQLAFWLVIIALAPLGVVAVTAWGSGERITFAVSETERSRVVLVVEDNPDNRITAQAILDDLGYEHVTVADGEAAIETALKIRPGLILMDIQLPGVSGLKATRRIRNIPALRTTPIVALTARAMKGDREEILAAGCDDYLSKPVDPAGLGDVMKEWLGQGARPGHGVTRGSSP